MSILLNRRTAAVAVLASAVVATGCARQPQIPEMTITASDYSFDAPDTIGGGLVQIHFINNGKEPHHAQFVRLNDGVSPARFDSVLGAAMQAAATEGDAAFGQLFQVATLAGGPSTINPGMDETVIDDLSPGNYRLFCFVAGSDGVPHLMKGMRKALVVTAPTAHPAPPKAQASVELTDFAIAMPTLKSARTLVSVTNKGAEPHELSIVRLQGISAAQFLQMVTAPLDSNTPAPSGPAPFEFVGGYQGIMPGQTGWTTLDLTPGDYVAVCLIPSPAHEGKPHVALGMSKAFTVS